MRLAIGIVLSISGLGFAAVAAFLVWAHVMFTAGSSTAFVVALMILVAIAVVCTVSGVWTVVAWLRRQAARDAAALDG